MTSENLKTHENRAGGFNAKKNKNVPKIGPTSGSKIVYTNDPRIPKSFVVALLSSSVTRIIVFHHPIGITKLDEDEWVATEKADIEDLLNRKNDPNESHRSELRQNLRMKWAVERGLIRYSDTDQKTLEYSNGATRSTILEAAEASAKAKALHDQKTLLLDDFLQFIPEPTRSEEIALRKYTTSWEVVADAESVYPDSEYLTRSGPLEDRDQRGVSYLKGETLRRAMDLVTRRLFD